VLPENPLKAKLAANRPIFGVISSSTDPSIAELIGLAGFDYYMVDAEHGLFTPANTIDIIRACETVGVTPLVRVGQPEPKLVLQYLDSGMLGVMMPGLESAEAVQMLVDAVKYPPDGKRGLGFSRAAGYMMGAASQADYVAWANANLLVIPQFEDVALLNRLPEMLAVPGVDMCVIGPRDLSMSMGYTDGPDHDNVQAVIDKAIGIIRDAGVAAGITAGSADAARHQLSRGATVILNSLPGLIKPSSTAFLSARPE
jgi:4-hydroxy-2-oxoheptanedioate aldolase